MWHRFVRWVGRRDLRWFYRDVVLVGAERIPVTGPVVLVANHPNDLPDVFVGYLSTPRAVHFVATISAASNPLARAIYRGLGVIPVTRVRDARRLLEQGADIADVNRRAYRRVVEALNDGALVALFPEGGVQVSHELGRLKAGAAQMMFQCLDAGMISELVIVPVGLQYETRDQPGSDCCVLVGEPLRLDPQAFPDPSERVPQLTARLHAALSAVTRSARTDTARRELDILAAVVGASVATTVDDALLCGARVAPQLRPAEMDETRGKDVRWLADLLTELGGNARSARDMATMRFASERTSNDSPTLFSGLRRGRLAALLVAAPVAAIGWLVHGPLFAFIWKLALRTAEDESHRVARAYVPGIYIVLVWYLLVAALTATGLSLVGTSPWLSPLLVMLLVMLLPRSGDIAVEWRHGLAARRLRARARALPVERRAEVRARFDALRGWWLVQDAAHVGEAPGPRDMPPRFAAIRHDTPSVRVIA